MIDVSTRLPKCVGKSKAYFQPLLITPSNILTFCGDQLNTPFHTPYLQTEEMFKTHTNLCKHLFKGI